MANEPTATIGFLGDIFFGDARLEVTPELADVLRQSDLRIGNLETPISEPNPIDSGKILLCSPPGSEAMLPKLGIDIVSLANNHIFDHGEAGFASTRAALEKVAIQYVGAGQDIEEASRAIRFEINGIRFGLIAATEEGTQALLAGPASPGCNTLDQETITRQIRDLCSEVDHVIVVPHWGYCEFAYPPVHVVRLGEALLRAGASAVVGHHSHVVQGARTMEDGAYIAYSLGNFFFDDYHITKTCKRKVQGENAHGVLLELCFSKTRCTESRRHFTTQRDGTLALDTNSKRERTLAKRSEPLRKTEGYERFWRSVVRKRMVRRALHWLNPLHWRQIRPATVVSALVLFKNMCGMKSKNETK